MWLIKVDSNLNQHPSVQSIYFSSVPQFLDRYEDLFVPERNQKGQHHKSKYVQIKQSSCNFNQ